MSYDVFISYSTVDKHVADAVCSTLENSSVRCWIAPRDIIPGNDWAQSIIDAIKTSKIMILVFSQNSNDSPQVSKELNLAVANKLMIIPFKIDNCKPSGNMEYFLADTHWLDAIDGDMQEQINKLKEVVVSVLPHSIKNDDGKEENGKKKEAEELTVKTGEAEIKEEKPAPKKAGFFASYKNLWKKCFSYRGTTAVSELLKAEVVQFLITSLLLFVVFMINTDEAAVIWILISLISVVPLISMIVRCTRGIKNNKITGVLKVEAAQLPLIGFWSIMVAVIPDETFAVMLLLYIALLAVPVLRILLEFIPKTMMKKRK